MKYYNRAVYHRAFLQNKSNLQNNAAVNSDIAVVKEKRRIQDGSFLPRSKKLNFRGCKRD